MTPHIIVLDSCPSTNSHLAALADAPHGTVVAAVEQTAGRGQRGNSWEAEPGCNLTFSQLLRPAALPAPRQFELSMAVSLAIADAIDAHLPAGVRCTIKWPNDIYVGMRKICGILIENKLAGISIERAIIGAGINVNQRKFISDAPNPTSIINENGGLETPLQPFLTEVTQRIIDTFDNYDSAPDPAALKERYMARLMWTSGEHPFSTPERGTFLDHIADVAFDGTLTLGCGSRHAFKEISYIIPPQK